MLAREVRMRDRREFTATVRSGRRERSGQLVVHFRGECASTRIGFIVSKAVGSAVVRNRVKRRLRHICSDLMIDDGSHVVVRALPPSARGSSSQLRADLRGALEKLGALERPDAVEKVEVE